MPIHCINPHGVSLHSYHPRMWTIMLS